MRSDRATGADELVKFGNACGTGFLQDRWRLAAGHSGRRTPALPHRHPPNQAGFLQGREVVQRQPLLQDRGAAARRACAFLRAGGHRHTLRPAADGNACADLPARPAAGELDHGAVRLNPAHDASGRVDIWLNGTFCGAYQGPMADRDYGAPEKVRPLLTRGRRSAFIVMARGDPDDLFRQDHVLERGPVGTPLRGG